MIIFRGITLPTVLYVCVYTIFEHARWPSFLSARLQLEQHGEADIDTLLEHFKTLFAYLGGDETKVQREWRRLKLFV